MLLTDPSGLASCSHFLKPQPREASPSPTGSPGTGGPRLSLASVRPRPRSHSPRSHAPGGLWPGPWPEHAATHSGVPASLVSPQCHPPPPILPRASAPLCGLGEDHRSLPLRPCPRRNSGQGHTSQFHKRLSPDRAPPCPLRSAPPTVPPYPGSLVRASFLNRSHQCSSGFR